MAVRESHKNQHLVTAAAKTYLTRLSLFLARTWYEILIGESLLHHHPFLIQNLGNRLLLYRNLIDTSTSAPLCVSFEGKGNPLKYKLHLSTTYGFCLHAKKFDRKMTEKWQLA